MFSFVFCRNIQHCTFAVEFKILSNISLGSNAKYGLEKKQKTFAYTWRSATPNQMQQPRNMPSQSPSHALLNRNKIRLQREGIQTDPEREQRKERTTTVYSGYRRKGKRTTRRKSKKKKRDGPLFSFFRDRPLTRRVSVCVTRVRKRA